MKRTSVILPESISKSKWLRQQKKGESGACWVSELKFWQVSSNELGELLSNSELLGQNNSPTSEAQSQADNCGERSPQFSQDSDWTCYRCLLLCKGINLAHPYYMQIISNTPTKSIIRGIICEWERSGITGINEDAGKRFYFYFSFCKDRNFKKTTTRAH